MQYIASTEVGGHVPHVQFCCTNYDCRIRVFIGTFKHLAVVRNTYVPGFILYQCQYLSNLFCSTEMNQIRFIIRLSSGK